MVNRNFEKLLAFNIILFEFIKKIGFAFLDDGINYSQLYLSASCLMLLMSPERIKIRSISIIFPILIILHTLLGSFTSVFSFDAVRLIFWLQFGFLATSIKDFSIDKFLQSFLYWMFAFSIASLSLTLIFGVGFIFIDNRFSFFTSEPSHFAFFVLIGFFAVERLKKGLFETGYVCTLAIFSFSTVALVALSYYAFINLPSKRGFSARKFRIAFSLLSMAALIIYLFGLPYLSIALEALMNKVFDQSNTAELNASIYSFISGYEVSLGIITHHSFTGLGASDFSLAYADILQSSDFGFHRLFGLNASTGGTLPFFLLQSFGLLAIFYAFLVLLRSRSLEISAQHFIVFYMLARAAKIAAPWEVGGLLAFIILFSVCADRKQRIHRSGV